MDDARTDGAGEGDASASAESGDPAALQDSAGCGTGCGLTVFLLIGVVAWGMFDLHELRGLEAAAFFGGVGGVIVLCAWGVRAKAAGDDRRNRVRQSAPTLPLRLAEVGENVWVEGKVVCARPESAPGFGVPCAWMRVRIVRGSGKSKKTERDDVVWARTWIADGDDRVELDLRRTAFHKIPQWTAKEGNRTTTVAGVPVGSRVRVCGVLRDEVRPPAPEASPTGSPTAPGDASDDSAAPESSPTDEDYHDKDDTTFRAGSGPGAASARVLGGDADVPLLVTPLDRTAWNAHVESEEAQWRAAGKVIAAGGVAFAAVGGGVAADWWAATDVVGWIASGAVGALVVGAVLLRGVAARIESSRRLAEDAAAALESDMARAATDREAAGVRVEARLRIYDFFAAEHNTMIAKGAGAWIARRRGFTPLPLRG